MRQIAIAIVHHANQYLITDGYENRVGLSGVIGGPGSKTGLRRVLESHRRFGIPFNLHISGTLIEALAWHQPSFLRDLQKALKDGLIEFSGSSYAQNIMRFFGQNHNFQQLNEELQLMANHFGMDACRTKVFWPPERVWDTGRMAGVLTNPALINGGYRYVIIDDRLLLPASAPLFRRRDYDRVLDWRPEMFRTHVIQNGCGIAAIPCSISLRHSIPPRTPEHWSQLEAQLRWLADMASHSSTESYVAVYADDMEKAAGIGWWDPEGITQFEEFLSWLRGNSWIRAVKIGEWAAQHEADAPREIETGTYSELADEFGAGEGYDRWYYDPGWTPHQDQICWSQKRVHELSSLGADPCLIATATKHLMASTWETAWHTPASGAAGCAEGAGQPAPWIRALASHSRHAAVIAEAAFWARHKDRDAHAYLSDLDNDGSEELILKNRELFAVLSPSKGGRLVFLFAFGGEHGTMLVGNPSDDWNFLEELNGFMDVPRNHPGALSDIGFEHDRYLAEIESTCGQEVCVDLQNLEEHSAARQLTKRLTLSDAGRSLRVEYYLPQELSSVKVEFGFSPDYLNLLRIGRRVMHRYEAHGARGWRVNSAAVWVKPVVGDLCWTVPAQEHFGHGRVLQLCGSDRQLAFQIGVGTL